MRKPRGRKPVREVLDPSGVNGNLVTPCLWEWTCLAEGTVRLGTEVSSERHYQQPTRIPQLLPLGLNQRWVQVHSNFRQSRVTSCGCDMDRFLPILELLTVEFDPEPARMDTTCDWRLTAGFVSFFMVPDNGAGPVPLSIDRRTAHVSVRPQGW